MTPPALPFATSPAPTPVAGVCRVCGCTEHEACIVDEHRVQIGGGFAYEAVTCSWVDESLCSRCWSPSRPTQAQAGEIARIQSRHGPVRVTRGRGRHQLEVALVGGSDLYSGLFTVKPAVLTLDASGRVVHRLVREVIARA